MPRVTFVMPGVGRFPATRYVRSWQMQPLAIAVLARLTPKNWSRTFFDDRLELVDYEAPTDLVAISCETYTARRAYQIARGFRRRGVPVVLGGYHPTFCPNEAREHGDAVCVGEAEGVWNEILADAEAGHLKPLYDGTGRDALSGCIPDRSIFMGKRYFPLALVEASRGCHNRCSFCSITAFHGATYRRRPPEEIVSEIREIGVRRVFFVDDNLMGDADGSRALFESLAPLGIRWLSQVSVSVGRDPELMDLMARSGCAGVLIGFESLDRETLAGYNKGVNLGVDYRRLMAMLRERGIIVYGTFMFGAAGDTDATVRAAVRFAMEQRLFLAAFAHVVPFPGTPLYRQLEADGSLVHDSWWLSEEFRFGDVPFTPAGFTPEGLRDACHRAREEFYGYGSILRRAFDGQANLRSLSNAQVFFGANAMLRTEVGRKRGLPLGAQGFSDEP
jgi:radical SAM superfamily enzyme YgiQ (UPF0313 family)